jgi:hypothetical protein
VDEIKIDIERPCALSLRYVPAKPPHGFMIQDIMTSITSAVSFSKTNYHRPRTTNDYRFCVIDENDEIINIDRLAINPDSMSIEPIIRLYVQCARMGNKCSWIN